MAGGNFWPASLIAIALLPGCDSKTAANFGTALPNACRFLSDADASRNIGVAVEGDNITLPDQDGKAERHVCNYDARNGSPMGATIFVTEGGDLDLPRDGDRITDKVAARYPALGAPPGSPEPAVVIHRGTVGDEPATWHSQVVDRPTTVLNTSSGKHGITVVVAATPDNVEVAKRIAATMQRNLADRSR